MAGKYAGRYVASSASYDGRSCASWTRTSTTPVAFRPPPPPPEEALCTESRPVACCATPTREEFAGFTTAAETGDVGGRAIMNFICATEFTGSHLCHTAEYYRSHATSTPPVEGAWIDYSAQWRDDTGSVYRVSSLAEHSASRYVAPNASYDGRSCRNWTGLDYNTGGLPAIAPADGLTMTPEGPEPKPCDEPRPLACCY
jgi:hypothetical protein